MQSLFAPLLSAEQAGYRLAYLEILNWGTFDGVPVRLKFEGRDALLTGANGAGKTTLLDALLTLLVPPSGTGRRVYNAAASTGGTRSGRNEEQRTDETYVLGYYGQNQREGQLRATPEALRDKRSHSVLLACFENSSLQAHLTAAQVLRYRASGDLRTDFLLAPVALGIADLGSFDAAGKWKQRLVADHQAELFTSFGEYGLRLRSLTGMRDKALALFGKSVALKELTSLNHFVRHEMLSLGKAAETFGRLKKQYDQLLATDRAIRQATRQVELLAPLPAARAQWQQAHARSEQLEQVGSLVQHLISEQMAQVLRTELAAAEEELIRLDHTLKATKRAKEQAQTRKEHLAADLRNHQATRQLDELQTRCTQLAATLVRQQHSSGRYAALATTLAFRPQPDATVFAYQTQQAAQREAELSAANVEATSALAEVLNDLNNAQRARRDVDEELQALRKQPASKVPKELQEVRRRLLAHLLPAGLTPEDLPFAGELLQVPPEAAAWEPALEKLLRSFALQLLVPDEQYAAVTDYVSANGLRLHLRYQRLPAEPALQRLALAKFPARSVGTLVVPHPTSALRAWVSQQVAQQFPHLCAHDAAELRQHEGLAAFTREGLVRHGDRHEKDDRHALGEAGHYVLGWNNLAKQASCEQQLVRYDAEIKQLAGQKTQLDAAAATRDRLRRAAQELQLFREYTDLDAASTAQELALTEAQLARLRASCNQLRELEAQLATAAGQVTQLETTLEAQNQQKGAARGTLDRLQRQQREAADLGAAVVIEASAELLAVAAPFLPAAGASLSYTQWQRAQQQAMEKLAREAKQAADQHAKKEQTVRQLLEQFASPSLAMLHEFPDWHLDLPPADPDPDNSADFVAVLTRLEHEALPPLRADFARYLRDELAIGIINFRAALNAEKEELERSIRELNTTLHTIDFNQKPTPTFIRLAAQRTATPRINQFRQQLAAIRANLNPDAEVNLTEQQATFAEIKALIELLSDDTIRGEVTDVRYWFDFVAQEFVRPDPAGGAGETGPSLRVYENSNALSKGQRAQLAYTFLCAAVAYQFGIRQQGLQGKSFRLLAIDEAFGDLDKANSEYLLALCRQLHLQLLVVTPLDKVNIVQKYMHSYHVVASADRRTSQVYSLTRTGLTDYLATAQLAAAD